MASQARHQSLAPQETNAPRYVVPEEREKTSGRKAGHAGPTAVLAGPTCRCRRRLLLRGGNKKRQFEATVEKQFLPVGRSGILSLESRSGRLPDSEFVLPEHLRCGRRT